MGSFQENWLSLNQTKDESVAIDGTCLDVADTPVNDAFFSRPVVSKGEKSAFPQARIVAVG
ncbi:hypothetical protein FGL98_23970 [Leekyejoonella antrihumi]|uniref:Uncharacterized protein n=1 Tax=Leekyejoonella antrihumi TaxID=1660198 RepID=A0A563DRH8_9MICO|nr:hypothetical protein FGL98_23970 [Leekyejoonella antrihumi]